MLFLACSLSFGPMVVAAVVMARVIAQLLLPLCLFSLVFASPIDIAERAVLVDNVAALNAEYDYVIIGGGTSGLTVANRLTENSKSIYIALPRIESLNKRLLTKSICSSLRACNRVRLRVCQKRPRTDEVLFLRL